MLSAPIQMHAFCDLLVLLAPLNSGLPQGGQKKGPSKLAQLTEQPQEQQASSQEPWETADTIMLNMLMVTPCAADF